MTTPFLTLLACTCILSCILIFVGGELTARLQDIAEEPL